MTPVYRGRLASHLTRRLCPRAQHQAREERRALYPSLGEHELRAQYIAIATELAACVDGRRLFLSELAADLVGCLALRGVRSVESTEAA